MARGSPRHNPEKPQNKYGGDYRCPHYDKLCDGTEFCHVEAGWSCFIEWMKTENDTLVCKGNLHNCKKLKYHWLASLPEKERVRWERKMEGMVV